MSAGAARVSFRDDAGRVLFDGTDAEFHKAAQRLQQGAGTVAMAKDGIKMKEDAGDIHVRERSYRVSAAELCRFVERVESLAADVSEIRDAMKEVYAEAKSRGYDTKCIRKLVAERKRDATDVAEERAVMDLYREALGR